MKKLTVLFGLFLGTSFLFAQPVLKKADSVNEYSIVYELYGGTNAASNKENYKENEKVTLAAPVRSGYTFKGWYWDSDFYKPLKNNSFENKKGSLKVYAKWDMLIDVSAYIKQNMIEIIPYGSKVTLEDFAGTSGPQDIFAYSITKYEVTQTLYEAVTGRNPSDHIAKKGENFPVESVSWYDAVYFCNELTKLLMGEEHCCYTITDIKKNAGGIITSASVKWNKEKKGYRLPTLAEWQMAARGGVKGGWDYTYSGSNNIDEVAWCSGYSYVETHEVGTKKPNAAGLYDMSGNVGEWCWVVYPDYSDYRYNCGGSYDYYDYDCKVGYRYSYYAYSRSNNLGFRIVCSASN